MTCELDSLAKQKSIAVRKAALQTETRPRAPLQQQKLSALERHEMGRVLGIEDEAILLRLQQIGFTHETIALLYFVPVILTAWAEGRLTRRERELIFAVAEQRGIKPNSEAYLKLLEWLIESPGKDFLEQSLQAIRDLLQTVSVNERAARQQEIVYHCTLIAEASGGLAGWLGLGSNICPEEQQMLNSIVTKLNSTQETQDEKSETYQERKAA